MTVGDDDRESVTDPFDTIAGGDSKTALDAFRDPVGLGEMAANNKVKTSLLGLVGVTALVVSIALFGAFWARHWGDIASVVGLIVTITGFIWTIQLAMQSKSAAERAEEAAIKARQSIQHFDAIIEVSQAIALLNEVMKIHREKEWRLLPERYATVRTLLVSVKNPTSTITEIQRTRIAGVLRQLQDVDDKIEACVHAGKKDGGPTKQLALLGILKVQVDLLTDTLAELRNNGS